MVDSRASDAGQTIRRRRQCLVCQRRFTTYERTGEGIKLFVIKKDKRRIPYDRERILSGIQKACHKRPVSTDQLQHVIDKTEEAIFRRYDKEVPTGALGEQVLKHLRVVDIIAYIRYASFSRHYQSASDYIDDLRAALQSAEPLEQLKLFNE